MEVLFFVISILFWPLLIIGVILFLLGRRRRRRILRLEEALQETETGLSKHLSAILKRVTALETRLASLEQRGPASAIEPVAPAVELPVVEAPAAAPPATKAGAIPAAEVIHEEAAPAAWQPAAAPVQEEISESRKRWQELARRFIENWTGILGAVVVVAGVTFVGIYTALQLDPFYRFLLTLAAAAALVAGAYVLARRDAWLAFAGWLRSAGAAIALFACAAAGGLPGLGLQWIQAPLPALALLLAGIAANLSLGLWGGTQATATLHVLLSLVPLAIVPASTTTLAIASAVILFGVILAARNRWDRHLAFILGGYLLFHAIWYLGMGAALDAEVARYVAAGCALVVFGPAAMAHYRKDYARPAEPSPLQVGVHLAGWLLLALAMFVYLPSASVRGAVLLVGGVIAWLLAQRGRATSIHWLARADVLVAQALVLLALLSAFDLGASWSLLLLLVLAETLGFRWLVPRGEDDLLDQVADSLPALAAALLAIAGFFDLGLRRPQIGLAATLMAGSALSVLGQWVLRAPREEEAPVEPAGELSQWFRPPGVALGTLAGVLVLVALFAVIGRAWFEAVALAATGVLLAAWTWLRRAGLQAGVTIALTGAHAMSWGWLLSHEPWAPSAVTQHLLPLAALAMAAVWIARSGWIRPLAVALAGITVGLAGWLYFEPVSSLIPGVVWLVLSLLALELANRLAGRGSSVVLLLAYGYLAAFFVNYALVIVQTPAYLGTVSARLLIEIFSLCVLAYWWLFRPQAELGAAGAWRLVHPLFVEMLLVGVAVTVVVEVAAQWWAVAWALLALLLLSPPAERVLDARARLYSLLFYWVSVIDMAVVVSALEVPSQRWSDQPEFTSLVAIALQVAYAAWAHRRLLLYAIEPPPPLRALGRLGNAVARRRNLYVYYPLFAGIALWLYWRFDRSVLTLLWAAEAFVVFVLSAWLRESQFRYLALAGLAACLGRLVWIDLAEANLVVRGVVFIGVGSLMLGMNAIYNRYRARFGA